MRMDGMDGTARSCVNEHVYYLALCVKENEGDVLSENNTVIEYDTERGTFMIRKGMRVKDFFAVGGKVYFTQADAPYEVLSYGDPDSGSYLGVPMESLWETPWLDLGKAYMKRDFVLRLTADADADDVPLEVTILTERREEDAHRAAQKAADRLPGEDSGERRADEAETAQPRQGGGMADLWRGAGGIQSG